MDSAMVQMNGAGQQFWGLGGRLRGGESNWNGCEKCYASLFEPYGFDHFLQPRRPVQLPSGGPAPIRQCDMCPGDPRKGGMLAKLQEAAYAGVFGHFTDWARRMADIPVCPRRMTPKDGTWYGWGQYRICPECWVDFACGTRLAPKAPLRGEVFTGEAICSMWSPRMRKMWRASCDTGDAAEMLIFADKRQLLYAKTIAVIERKVDTARAQFTTSTAYQDMQIDVRPSIADARLKHHVPRQNMSSEFATLESLWRQVE